MKDKDFGLILRKVIDGQDLKAEDVKSIIIDGLTAAQSGGLLIALKIKGPTKQELELGRDNISSQPNLVEELPWVLIETFRKNPAP